MSTICRWITSLLLFFIFFTGYTASCQHEYAEGKSEYFNGDVQKAIVLFTRAIEDKDSIAASYMMRGAAKGKTGDLSGAIKDLDSSKSRDSGNYKLFFYYGRVYLLNNDPNSALRFYYIAAQKNPRDADTYDDLAMSKIELSDLAGGIADEDTAIAIDPQNIDYYTNRGFAKMQLGQYNAAIADFNTSIGRRPSQKALANRGYAFLQTGSYQAAIDDFTKELDIYPKDYMVFYYRGLAYEKLGQKDQACADFKSSVDLGYLKAREEAKNVCP